MIAKDGLSLQLRIGNRYPWVAFGSRARQSAPELYLRNEMLTVLSAIRPRSCEVGLCCARCSRCTLPHVFLARCLAVTDTAISAIAG